MTYTIRIHQTESDLAKRLFWYLKSLSQTKEYEFLEVEEDETGEISHELANELDIRYEHFLKHHEEYPDWEEVKHKFIAK